MDHSTCANAYKPVRCDRCGRTYTCTPGDDLYCTDTDHSCEPCLLGGLEVYVLGPPPSAAAGPPTPHKEITP